MSLRFHNTLHHAVEEFRPLQPGQIGLYTCGPTVYDFPHIGNYRTFVFEDLVKRYLLYSGYRVKHVMNLTDIDDKTIRKAAQQGVSLEQVTTPFIDAFFSELKTLNVVLADVYPRATAHIAEMVELIEELLAKGFAYRKGDSIYFSIARFPDYGRLANLDMANLKPGVSVDLDEYEKEAVQDFVLWKGQKPGEPSWDTAVGPGRPGWHIECSAMSAKYLGRRFDIHMGGVDNIFPHHENEIAQSECANGEPFVNYWVHCQHLVVENRKMAKSAGNFYRLGDLLEKGVEPMAVRYLLLATHYRKLLNFTFAGLEGAHQALQRLRNFVSTLREQHTAPGETAFVTGWVDENETAFRACMDDDFNISGALGVLFEFVHRVNGESDKLRQGDVARILAFVERLNSVLGVLETAGAAELEPELADLLQQRQQARRDRDFARADALRDELKRRGITLMDSPDGMKWRRD
jgi:cysteinyl-tRNA synthetase